MTENQFTMKFQPSTIQHLGIQMYTQVPKVLAELISNAYDADAEHVKVTLINDDGTGKKQIIIEDDGIGLLPNEVNDKFLKIGRNRRDEDSEITAVKKRKVIGKKGIGKLAFFGISPEVDIITVKDKQKTKFNMKWKDIENADGEYHPSEPENELDYDVKHGTKIILKNISRKTDLSYEDIAKSLAKIFIISNDFDITVCDQNDKSIQVDNKARFEDLTIEITKEIPLDITDDNEKLQQAKSYFEDKGITGKLYTTLKPVKTATDLRGITLFSRTKMVQSPDYFSESASSHFFSYLTGYLEVSFIDDLKPDVIATHRQALNWSGEEMLELKGHIQTVEAWLQDVWRETRKENKRKKIKEKYEIDVSKWYENAPEEVREDLERLVNNINEFESLSEEEAADFINFIYEKLITENSEYQWRFIHKDIREKVEPYYKSGDFFKTFYQAYILYANEVKRKSKITNYIPDAELMTKCFEENGLLNVTSKYDSYVDSKGTPFDADTKKQIRKAHEKFSHGIVKGARNQMAHVSEHDLVESNLFNKTDCLNLLNLLSYLFRRLDDA